MPKVATAKKKTAKKVAKKSAVKRKVARRTTNLKQSTSFNELLNSLGACSDAKSFVGNKSLAQSWVTCKRPDWMLWLCGQMADKPGWATSQKIVLVACDIARGVLHLTRERDREVCQKAIDAAEAWGNGTGTRGGAIAAARAAYAAYAAADAARSARAARSAYAAVYAARAAYAAAYAAAHAAARAAYAAARAADAAAYAADSAAYAAARAADAAAYAAKCKEICELIRTKLNLAEASW